MIQSSSSGTTQTALNNETMGNLYDMLLRTKHLTGILYSMFTEIHPDKLGNLESTRALIYQIENNLDQTITLTGM